MNWVEAAGGILIPLRRTQGGKVYELSRLAALAITCHGLAGVCVWVATVIVSTIMMVEGRIDVFMLGYVLFFGAMFRVFVPFEIWREVK